jgi:hypothetical protein
MEAEQKDLEHQAERTSFRDRRSTHPEFLIMNLARVESFDLVAQFSSQPEVSTHPGDESMHHRNILEELQKS